MMFSLHPRAVLSAYCILSCLTLLYWDTTSIDAISTVHTLSTQRFPRYTQTSSFGGFLSGKFSSSKWVSLSSPFLTDGDSRNKGGTAFTSKYLTRYPQNGRVFPIHRKASLHIASIRNSQLCAHSEDPWTPWVPLSKRDSLDKARVKTLSIIHKLIAAGSYCLPLLDAFQAFNFPLMMRYPKLSPIFSLITPILFVYTSVPMLPFALFMGSYMIFVKKNIFNLPYFVKYNVMQSLLLSMFHYAFAMLYFRVSPFSPMDDSPLNEMILLTTVLSCFGMIFNSMFSTLLGNYPTFPVISEAVNMHIGDKPEEEP
ncbi:TIC20 [Cardiosporidium cionae]|uniref:TIC20 n=1 Tax=Cardiosporidium cionae TaxID=476202 RepID=A0ABQ7J7I4_9APIC|nr:TIC20 [Cardiosporidium cionae]|eukprot:KAF8819953.1 TIC20 [Cardiosporidium cionae]